MKIRSLCLLPVVLLTAACASTGSVGTAPATTPDYQYTANPRFDAISRADNKHDCDRLAILAMQGRVPCWLPFPGNRGTQERL